MYKNFTKWLENKQALVALDKASKTPPPFGVNPQAYKAKLEKAKKVAQAGQAKDADEAIELANIQDKASK